VSLDPPAGAACASTFRALRDGFVRRRHTALLAAIVLAFAVRPLIGGGRVTSAVFSFAFLGLMCVALYTVRIDELVGERDRLLRERRRRSVVAFVLVAAAIAERVSAFLAPNPHVLLVGGLAWMAFFAFVTWAELRSVLRQKAITGETISMSISVYLLFGITWSFLYFVIYQIRPDAFSFGGGAPIPNAPLHDESVLPNFVYFSLITLSTVGYGDITPLTIGARYAAAVEGITGQFYLAILVAGLVGFKVTQAMKD